MLENTSPYNLDIAPEAGSRQQDSIIRLIMKSKTTLLPSTLNSDWRICLVERRHICIPGIQYTSYGFDTETLVVPFSGLKISCSIITVLEATMNSSAFEFAVSTQP